ncbi:hypothetical protein V5799_027279 [Amblyomma americanum]|uniref:Uncharacterized protein n=1 Tax=Amblyomma americanum TaxID=6943 RepID=A0AAQ4DG62_AMBAM
MEPEVQQEVNRPVLLINRAGLYVILAVLAVSILGCLCVLGYSFTNHEKLKRNAEEVRNFIASQTKTAERRQGVSAASVGNASSTTTTKAAASAAAPAYQPKVGVGAPFGVTASKSAGDAYALVARQEAAAASSTTAASAQRQDVVTRSSTNQTLATVTGAAATATDAPTEYPAVAANVSVNAVERNFTGTP